MNRLLLLCYFLFFLVTQCICQTFNVIQQRTPNGGVKYFYKGKEYNTLDDITNEISGGNSNMKFVTQYNRNGPNSPYGNSVYNTYDRYNSHQPNGNTISEGINKFKYYQPSGTGVSNGYGNSASNSIYGPKNPNGISNTFYPKPSPPNGLKSYGYSDKIWEEVWKGYDYNTDRQKKFSDFKTRLLREHNFYRNNHEVPPLSYDYIYLDSKAENYANYLASRGNLQLIHDKENNKLGLGENLAMAYSSSINKMIKAWYDEWKKYDFTKNTYTPGLGHFTQIVWKSTTKIGCGLSSNNNGYVFLVCKYSPAGNVGYSYKGYVNPPRNKF